MAIVRVNEGALRFEDEVFANGTFSGTQTIVRYTYSPGNYYEFRGTFDYNDAGEVIGGTVNTIAEYSDFHARSHFAISGIAIDAPTLFRQPDLLSAGPLVLGGDDEFLGRDKNDSLYAFDGDDRLNGHEGSDTLYGMVGDDALRGSDGRDRLIGGEGKDRLVGGDNDDTFVFTSLLDSTVASDGRDRIVDFSHAENDKIDLSQIDAITGDGDDAFTLVDAFHDVPGELTVRIAPPVSC